MTWLTERDRDARPAGDRLAALWARPGIVRLPGAHDPLAALLARRAGFEALYLSGAAVTASLALPPSLWPGLSAALRVVGVRRMAPGPSVAAAER